MRCWHCGQSAVHQHCIGDEVSARGFSCADCNRVAQDSLVSINIQSLVALEKAERQKELLEDLRDSERSTLLFASGDSPIALLKRKCNERQLSVVITPLKTDGKNYFLVCSF